MKIFFDKNFLKSVKLLSKEKQEKLSELLEFLSENPFHPYLHSKPLKEKLTGFYSFRITREWRVIFQFLNTNEIKLVKVGHRRDIYKK